MKTSLNRVDPVRHKPTAGTCCLSKSTSSEIGYVVKHLNISKSAHNFYSRHILRTLQSIPFFNFFVSLVHKVSDCALKKIMDLKLMFNSLILKNGLELRVLRMIKSPILNPYFLFINKKIIKAGTVLEPQAITSVKPLEKDPLEGFKIPERRYPPAGMPTIDPPQRGSGLKNVFFEFIQGSKILKKHPIKYLEYSPDISSVSESFPYFEMFEEDMKALAVTTNGKHVLLQENLKASFFACMSMLVLDNKTNLTYKDIKKLQPFNSKDLNQWLHKVKLIPLVHTLDSTQSLVDQLFKLLLLNGPGVINITKSSIGPHDIVLDSIDKETLEVMIRDPYHGWMISISIDTLLEILNRSSFTFTQVFNDSCLIKNSDTEIQKLLKNAAKAITEHLSKSSSDQIKGYAVLGDIQEGPGLGGCRFNHTQVSIQGRRNTNEDAHFYVENDACILMGVFDGHGGSDVANLAAKMFPVNFFHKFKSGSTSITKIFTEVIDDIQQKIKSLNLLSGSTSVVSYIDKANSLIYTATLGDSEANIYRRINGRLKSIPVSCVRDWSSKKDFLRREKYFELMGHGTADVPKTYLKNPKLIRIKDKTMSSSVNLSRSIGDILFNDDERKIYGIIQKPKITVQNLQANDIVILACDGVKDFVPESTIVQVIENCDPEVLAHGIANTALEEYFSNDNVTVITLNVSKTHP